VLGQLGLGHDHPGGPGRGHDKIRVEGGGATGPTSSPNVRPVALHGQTGRRDNNTFRKLKLHLVRHFKKSNPKKERMNERKKERFHKQSVRNVSIPLFNFLLQLLIKQNAYIYIISISTFVIIFLFFSYL
jgi:hypothetical protein